MATPYDLLSSPALGLATLTRHSRRKVLGAAAGGAVGRLGAFLVAPERMRSAAAQVDPIATGPDGSPERPITLTLAPDGPEIAAYKRGVAQMKDWNELDPTDPMFRLSWMYQASIHGRVLAQGQDPGGPHGVWNTCQHFSWFFLPWHRLYLYWFERIVRKAWGMRTSHSRIGTGSLPTVNGCRRHFVFLRTTPIRST